MRSARKRAFLQLCDLLGALALIVLAVTGGMAIASHLKEHGHGVAGGPGAQGGELQVRVALAGVHVLHSSGQPAVSA